MKPDFKRVLVSFHERITSHSIDLEMAQEAVNLIYGLRNRKAKAVALRGPCAMPEVKLYQSLAVDIGDAARRWYHDMHHGHCPLRWQYDIISDLHREETGPASPILRAFFNIRGSRHPLPECLLLPSLGHLVGNDFNREQALGPLRALQSYWFVYARRKAPIIRRDDFKRAVGLLAVAGVFSFYPCLGVCYLIPWPHMMIAGDRGSEYLHCLSGPAVFWPDCEAASYFINGWKFRPHEHEGLVDQSIPLLDYRKYFADNDGSGYGQLFAALSTVPPRRIVKELAAPMGPATARGNRLYVVGGLLDLPLFYLEYTCPSTGKVYYRQIPDTNVTAYDPDEIQARRFLVSKETYLEAEES